MEEWTETTIKVLVKVANDRVDDSEEVVAELAREMNAAADKLLNGKGFRMATAILEGNE